MIALKGLGSCHFTRETGGEPRHPHFNLLRREKAKVILSKKVASPGGLSFAIILGAPRQLDPSEGWMKAGIYNTSLHQNGQVAEANRSPSSSCPNGGAHPRDEIARCCDYNRLCHHTR